MDKFRLIRENEEQFKRHLEEIENLKIQEKEQNIDNMILLSNIEQKKQNKEEKYLIELRKKASAENSGLIKKESNNNLYGNLNNFVFNQIYDDSNDDFINKDNFLQYNQNENEFENINNLDDKYPNEQIIEYEDKSFTDISNDNLNNNNNDMNKNLNKNINNNMNCNKNCNTNYSMNNNINNDIPNEFSNNFNNNILSNNISKNQRNNLFDNINKQSQTNLENKENQIFKYFGINKKIESENSKNLNNNIQKNNNINIFNNNNCEQGELSNKINNFLKDLNEKLNLNYCENNFTKDNNNFNGEKINNNKNQNFKKHSNIGKAIGKFLESDKEEGNKLINYNEMVSKVLDQPYTSNLKKSANLNNNNTNLNKTNYKNYENYKPIKELRIKPVGWKPEKFTASYKISKAIKENKGKKEYSAHTYSTVQKIKNITQKKKKKSKIIYLY